MTRNANSTSAPARSTALQARLGPLDAAAMPVYWWIRGNGAPALDTVVASETPVAADAK